MLMMVHNSLIHISASSSTVLPSVVEWALREDVDMFFDHLSIVIKLFYYLVGITISITWICSLVDWWNSNQHQLLALQFRILNHELLELGDLDCVIAWISHSIHIVIADVLWSERACSFSRATWTPNFIALRYSDVANRYQ